MLERMEAMSSTAQYIFKDQLFRQNVKLVSDLL